MKRPTFFISSTIYDFRDLRSALKFYLEEYGFEVLASEFNDFRKPLEEHSYDACLKAIHSADYFLLLIGGRVGGWYDEASKISITQQEYREAYELQKAGKIKIINLVRSDIWQVREERSELVKYLESIDLSTINRELIKNYPSKFADDAEFLSNFIAEVSRNAETKQAIKGKGDPPKGNWVHVFSDFRDIIDVLKGQVFSLTPVKDLTAKRLLRRELQSLLARCLVKTRDGLSSPRWWIEKFHKETPVTLDWKEREYINVQTKSWDQISTLSTMLLACELNVVVLPQIISQSTFLDFDSTANSYKETEVYEALLLLQEELRRFKKANTNVTLSVIFENSPKYRSSYCKSIDIKAEHFLGLVFLLDRWSNIVSLCTSLIYHLDGEHFEMPELFPFSPVEGMQEHLDRERPTLAEVDLYIKNHDE
ncbi:MAG: DUF4062 domain-containing protein [Bacteroidota bacterium]|nr:DUF4062 domain-containing protein [Bacteroidota bacterium]